MRFWFPGTGDILVIAPHPDDEALGCSGTILRAVRDGSPVTVLYLTCGERLLGDPSEEVRKTRTAEARRAADLMGCAGALFLNLPDGGLPDNEQRLYDDVRQVLDQKKPGLVLAPSPLDYHADHLAASRVARQLHRDLGSFVLAFYEVYAAVRFTHLVEITDVIEEKKEVIRTYSTSLWGNPEGYIRASLGLNAHRSIFTRAEGFYEAFWVVEKPLTEPEATAWLTYGS